jgi:hypothetical protein
LETRRPHYYVLAVLAMAASVLASVYGATALMLGVLCMFAVWGAEVRLVGALGLAAYLLVSPFLPPSLIATIRSNQQRFPGDAWSGRSFLALAIVVLGAALIALVLARRRASRHVRFFLLFAFVTLSIPILDTYLNLHFLPQPARYTAEMELGLAMAISAFLSWAWPRIPRKIAAALVVFFLSIAAEQTLDLARFAQQTTRPVDITQKIEFRIARWVDEHIPGQRVMVPGSIAQWFNAFSDTPQLSGASFSTTPNWNQQLAMTSILTAYNPREVEEAILWLKAFGIQAAVAGGRNTPEFWKGVSSTKFDGQFPVLWRQQDTTIYQVPQRSPSLAHVIPVTAAGDLRQYVAALDDASLPLAEMRWDGFRHMSIQTSVNAGQAVSVQTCYHHGWHAIANDRAAPIRRDGLGFLLIEPQCQGPCRIELSYNGGAEYILCRCLSYLTLLGVAAYFLSTHKRRKFDKLIQPDFSDKDLNKSDRF